MQIEKILKKIKAENNKINKLRYKKKKDPELFQLYPLPLQQHNNI
jgi:hypothetical protein